jgi:hypothetical protein
LLLLLGRRRRRVFLMINLRRFRMRAVFAAAVIGPAGDFLPV